jgi:acetyl-CoA decarbonylase/synthase, CODH/ACS complex subunit gamma
MALTAVDIFKHLPKTNCRDCGVPTCLAFAMKVAQKQAALDVCPHVTDDAKAALAGESAPPIRLVAIGAGDKKLEIGQETVLFRHENTFHHPCGIAVLLDAGLDDAAVGERLAHIKMLQFDRVGMTVGINLVAVKGKGDAARLAAVAQRASDEVGLPVVLMGSGADELKPAATALADKKPLLYAATAENVDGMAALAKETGCPVVVKAADAGALLELTPKLVDAGVQDLVLATEASRTGDILAQQTIIRRAALNKKERRLGYPTLVVIGEKDPLKAATAGTLAIAKYAGIVVVEEDSRPTILAMVTARLNIYTDPQKPIQIEAKLYEVGTPSPESPVLVTTNFSLTYFTVEGDVLASKIPTWIVVVDTEGTSVLTAWASEKFSAESIAAAMKKSGVEEKVTHRKVVIPGGVAVLSGKLEDESGWKVQVGPRESSGIPTFLRSWSPN